MPSVHGSRAFEMRKQLSRPIRQFMRNDLPWRAAPKIATRLTGSASPSGSSTVVAARAFTDMVPVWSMLIHETAMLGSAQPTHDPQGKDWDCRTHSPVTARVRATSFFNFGLKFFLLRRVGARRPRSWSAARSRRTRRSTRRSRRRRGRRRGRWERRHSEDSEGRGRRPRPGEEGRRQVEGAIGRENTAFVRAPARGSEEDFRFELVPL